MENETNFQLSLGNRGWLKLQLAAILGLLHLSAGNDPVGSWCGEYQDVLYAQRPAWRFVAHFRFCEDGDVLIDLTGKSTTTGGQNVTPMREWGKWEKARERYTITTAAPQFPKLAHKLVGHWRQDGNYADFTIWDQLWPAFTDGKAIGAAQRCEVPIPCTPPVDAMNLSRDSGNP